MTDKKNRFMTAMILGLCTILAASPCMILAEEAPETEMVAETETEPETEEVFSEEKIMFVLDTLKVHKGPSAESKTIAYSDLGSSVSVLGQLGDWYHVRLDDPYEKAQEQEAQTEAAQDGTAQTEVKETEGAPAKEGYVAVRLLSEDREELEQIAPTPTDDLPLPPPSDPDDGYMADEEDEDEDEDDMFSDDEIDKEFTEAYQEDFMEGEDE